MFQQFFSFADVCWQFDVPWPVASVERIRVFEGDSGAVRLHTTVQPWLKAGRPGGEMLAREPFFEVWREGDGQEMRYFYDDEMGYYARYCFDAKVRSGRIEYLAGAEPVFDKTTQLLRHVGFATELLSCGRLPFHAALCETGYGGVLFAGPSGVGKSTQAALWEKHRGARQINGDRPVLYCRDGVWQGSGSPYAGSSGCYVNESLPIRAVVFLQQDKTCFVQELSAAEIFRRNWEGMIQNSWNREYMEQLLTLTEELTTRLPACLLHCTPDEKAVMVLERWLETRKECDWHA